MIYYAHGKYDILNRYGEIWGGIKELIGRYFNVKVIHNTNIHQLIQSALKLRLKLIPVQSIQLL